MDKELKYIDESCGNSVSDIRISDETKALLLCRARLGDIYNTVDNVVNDTYGRKVEDEFKGFEDAFWAFDKKLAEIAGTYMDRALLGSGFKTM